MRDEFKSDYAGLNRPPDVHERYSRDAQFHALVDILHSFLIRCDFTPSELREAVIKAACKVEMMNPHRTFNLGTKAAGEALDMVPSRFMEAVLDEAKWREEHPAPKDKSDPFPDL